MTVTGIPATSIGSSGRSPHKHALIDKMLGQQVAAFCTPRVQAVLQVRRMLIVDPTAGDGVDATSSPQLVVKHADYVVRHGRQVDVVMIERDLTAFRALEVNAAWPLYAQLINADAREYLPEALAGCGDAALFYPDDPNHSGDSTLTSGVQDGLFKSPALTVVCAIGTNANGMSRDHGHYERSLPRYLELLDRAGGVRYYRRQAVLCRLVGDAHRWAYLVVGSQVFADRVVAMFRGAMQEVTVQYGGRRLKFKGELHVGFDAVQAELVKMHTRREK